MLREVFDGPLPELSESSDDEVDVNELQALNESDAVVQAERPATPATSEPLQSARQKRDKKRAKHKRQARRAGRVPDNSSDTEDDKLVAKKRRLEATADAIYVDYCLPSDANVTGPGWTGKTLGDLPPRVFSLSEVVEDYKMTYFKWDGQYVLFPCSMEHCLTTYYARSTHLLLDKDGYIIGVLLGAPRDPGWPLVNGEAFDALDKAATLLSYKDKTKAHRRGEFPSLAHGISFGGGQQVCIFLLLLLVVVSALIE